MRIVSVADTHMFHDELVVPAGDVFLHAGDLCRGGTMDELVVVAEWIRALPHRVKVVVAGNHDWAFVHDAERARAALGDDVVYLQDAAATLDGVRFWGAPWQPAYNGWAFNLPRGPELAARWALIDDATDVLVTHGPPAGCGDGSTTGGRSGCADLRARVRAVRPKLHLFGHIHEDGGVTVLEGTTFVNCTTWECERAPTVVDYDAATGQVTPVVVPPARR